MYYRLVRINSNEVQNWNLDLPATVGRGGDATVCIDDDSISRSHCRLSIGPDEALVVRDSGSTNGTYVNGERVHQPHSLVPGDVLQIGAVSLRVEYASDTDPGPAGAKKSKAPTAMTQRMPTLSQQKFTMEEVTTPDKKWWEFWKE